MIVKQPVRNTRDLSRDINEFKNGYQPRTALVKDEKGEMFADSYSVLSRWKYHSCQSQHVHGVNDVRQTEMHAAEPLVPKPSASEVETAIEKLALGLQSKKKKTFCFYGTGYILCPYF